MLGGVRKYSPPVDASVSLGRLSVALAVLRQQESLEGACALPPCKGDHSAGDSQVVWGSGVSRPLCFLPALCLRVGAAEEGTPRERLYRAAQGCGALRQRALAVPEQQPPIRGPGLTPPV